MDGFRFILENPHPGASNNKQRKRARLVTACDSCRVKKIKCQQPVPNGRCDACKIAKIPCLFGDRDRYQAERGVTCTWNSPVEDVPDISDVPLSSSRKRKLKPVPDPMPSSSSSPQVLRSISRASSTAQSRSTTPAGPSMSSDRYIHPEQHAGPSYQHGLSVFCQPTPQDTHDVPPTSYGQLPLFDPHRPRFPHPYRLRQLAAVFFDNLGSLFPFLDRYDVLHRIEQQTCSAILSNCIAGLALRYVSPDLAPRGASYYDNAKSLASCVVSVPSVEVLHALICLTWAEYGAGHDGAFWIYSRMAIAMSLDLGLGCEATIQVAATPEVRHRLRLTWWTVVCTADIAAAWVTGRSATLDLDQYDTQPPDATDDMSLLFRNVADLYVLRGKLNRVLDAHVDNRGDSSLDWDLSKLQTNLENMSKALPPALVFSEENLVVMRDHQMGHVFVQMHMLIHAVSALVNRPSLLPSYGLPVPMEGPRAEAARSCAKSLADVLLTVERAAPETLCDPFMDLPVLVACSTFIADATASPATAAPHSAMLMSQWSDTFLRTCKESLVRLSATWGGGATFDNVLDRYAGMVAGVVAGVDDAHLAASSCFTTPYPLNNDNSQAWLLLPNLLDDEASDSSRSSSRELSPLLGPLTTTDCGLKYHNSFYVGGSPLVHEVDDSGVKVNTGAREASFYPLDLIMPSPGPGPGPDTTPALREDLYDAGGITGYFDEPAASASANANPQLPLSMNGLGAQRLLDTVQMWRAGSDATRSVQQQPDFASLQPSLWANQYMTSSGYARLPPSV